MPVPRSFRTRFSLIATGLLLACLTTPAAASPDGTWSVKTSAETGACQTNFDFKVAVKNGKVTYAGYWPVKASGGINKVGVVRMVLAHGGHKVTATGLARGDEASGDWTSPHPSCAGSWMARRV